MIPLGWSIPVALPPEIAVETTRGLTLLSIPRAMAPSAQARLRWQLAVVEAGNDLLPIAPSQDVSLPEARKLSTASIAQAYADITGKVQFTLSLAAPETPVAAKDGRAWMQERQRTYAAAAAQQSALNCFLKDLSLPHSSIRRAGSGQCVDVLVPRCRPEHLQERLENLLGKYLPETASVSLTGPWPPLGFAALPTPVAA